MHKPAMTYDFDQSTIVQFVCMMRECSRANLVSPEKASQRYRVFRTVRKMTLEIPLVRCKA